jgi:hypothetical protein
MPQGEIGQESPKWFGMQIVTAHKTKTENLIEEPSNPFNSWNNILSRSPLTPGSHALEVILFIDFEN